MTACEKIELGLLNNQHGSGMVMPHSTLFDMDYVGWKGIAEDPVRYFPLVPSTPCA